MQYEGGIVFYKEEVAALHPLASSRVRTLVLFGLGSV